MDEETMRKEFEEWAKPGGYFIELDRRGYYRADDTRAAFEAWLESARRADREAREECAEIIRARKVAIECAAEYEQAYNHAIDDAIQAIHATIPENENGQK